MNMQEIWRRIETCLKTNASQVFNTLQSGVSDEQIQELEEFLSIKLPEDVKSSYRIHNGQIGYDCGLMEASEFLSLERIKNEWIVWKELLDSGTFQREDGQDQGSEPEKGICNVWWSPQWIPLTYDGCGNHYCLDLNPSEEGTMGQIITMWHDDPERKIVAASFQAWLEKYAEGLESGQFIFSEEYGGIVDVNYI